MKQFFKLIIITLTLLLFTPYIINAQKYDYNWVFGNKAAIQFSGSPLNPSALNSAAMGTIASVTMSDNATGELLFYTTGERIWNKNHQLMPNGTFMQPNLGVESTIAVPSPDNSQQYYIFSINFKNELWYSVVDMSLDGGLGDVTNKKSILLNLDISPVLTAVKNQDGSGYWLITKSQELQAQSSPNNKFIVYSITKNGIEQPPVISDVGEVGKWFGRLRTDSKGTTIVLTENTDTSAKAQVFNFNKQNGSLSNPITLHKENDWDYAYGVAFSPDDTKLYISYSGVKSNKTESYVVQYSGTDFSNWSIVATTDRSKNSFNDILLGPDGRLYIDNSVAIPFVVNSTLDVIENPNNPAPSVTYIKDFINLGNGEKLNVRLPNFITDKSKGCGLPEKIAFSNSNPCTSDTTRFNFNSSIVPDSVLWRFSDVNSNDTLSKLTNGTHKYSAEGTYQVALDFFLCGNKKTFFDTVSITEFKTSLGKDSVFCYNGSIELQSDNDGIKYLWSTGDSSKTITVNAEGVYWIKVTTPTCSATDSIFIAELPPILINLGSGYTVCEHDTDDLVKLDAGKGYTKYKWTPTQDTTQWIIVRQAGDYYVVVEDFRGCKGDDGSKVLRLCNFDFHIPNAFTPNGDGLNDVFKATALDILDLEFEIFNSWGERVFMTNNPQQGWDGTFKGKPCPEGIYLYKVSFTGYSNKQLKTYNFKGNVSLLR